MRFKWRLLVYCIIIPLVIPLLIMLGHSGQTTVLLVPPRNTGHENVPLKVATVVSQHKHPIGAMTKKTFSPSHNDSEQGSNITLDISTEAEKPLLILYWTQWSMVAKGSGASMWGIGTHPFEHCKHKCETTNDWERLNESDVVFINPWILENHAPIPPHRTPNQIYLMHVLEAPTWYDVRQDFRGMFNATYTYKLDSDIPHLMWTIEAGPAPGFEGVDAVPMVQPDGKPKRLISWVVSHCTTPGKREEYVDVLQKFIEVDIYGKCGPYECPGEDKRRKMFFKHPCHEMMSEKYLFYLGFENALCEDYVTEKCFRTLLLNMVPIVYGGADYKRILPPHSFIDIEDFESPKSLATYLKLLATNPAMYREYFAWKATSHVGMPNGNVTRCQACETLHRLRSGPPQMVNITTFFGMKETCPEPHWLLGQVKETRTMLNFSQNLEDFVK